MVATDFLSERAQEILRRLVACYGVPSPGPPRDDPLAQLVQTILSQNTSDVNSERAYTSLWTRFSSWESIAAAEVDDIAQAIRAGGLAQVKAPRIKRVLDQVRQDRGRLSLDFLRDLDDDAVREYLTSLPGVGPKTAACVLLFSLGRPAIPVDTHVHRVARRLGLVGPRVTPEDAETALEAMVPPEAHYRFHLSLIRHGRAICKAPRPLCSRCPLNDICPKVGVRVQG